MAMTPEDGIKAIIALIDREEVNHRPAIIGYAEIRRPLVELAEEARDIAAKVGIVIGD